MVQTHQTDRTGQTRRWPDLLLYEPCQVVLGVLAVGYYFLPIPVRWKGRTYGQR